MRVYRVLFHRGPRYKLFIEGLPKPIYAPYGSIEIWAYLNDVPIDEDMPGHFEMLLNEPELNKLISYLTNLKKAQAQ